MFLVVFESPDITVVGSNGLPQPLTMLLCQDCGHCHALGPREDFDNALLARVVVQDGVETVMVIACCDDGSSEPSLFTNR